MNQKGFSWPETMLTLVVLVVIFGTLLPLATKITSRLYEKKLAMYAAETAYHGTITYHAYKINKGTRHIDDLIYSWEVMGNTVCVSYEPIDEVMTKCVDFVRS